MHDTGEFHTLLRQLYAADVVDLAPLSAIPHVRAVLRARLAL